MIDINLKVYLIEVNTNPCLELACPLLARLIPMVLENAVKYYKLLIYNIIYNIILIKFKLKNCSRSIIPASRYKHLELK